MQRKDTFTLSIWGLEGDNMNVRADVMCKKLPALHSALEQSDHFVNGKKNYEYMYSAKDDGKTAVVAFRERLLTRAGRGSTIPKSSTTALGETMERIRKGDRGIAQLPATLVKQIKRLSDDAEVKFSHAEGAYSADSIIRIDTFLGSQAERLLRQLNDNQSSSVDKFFSGAAFAELTGSLVVVDGRGNLLKGKLTLDHSGKEIDCEIKKEQQEKVLKYFNTKVRTRGICIYTKDSPVPARFELIDLDKAPLAGDLIRWRGALNKERQNGWDLND
jgi:hypothetical protein